MTSRGEDSEQGRERGRMGKSGMEGIGLGIGPTKGGGRDRGDVSTGQKQS